MTDDDWVATAKELPEVGAVISVRLGGRFPVTLNGRFFLHDDGEFYQIKPPRQLSERPAHWRHWRPA